MTAIDYALVAAFVFFFSRAGSRYQSELTGEASFLLSVRTDKMQFFFSKGGVLGPRVSLTDDTEGCGSKFVD